MCLQAREVRVARDPDNAARGTVTAGAARPARRRGVGAVAAPRRGRAVAVGADPGRRRRARRDGHDRAARAQRADGRRARRGQERGAVARARAPRRSTRRRGCGCSTASSSSCRRGRRARSGSPARTSTRRSRCCASCARRWRRAIASCSPAASARSPARTGCRCTWWPATSWRSTSAPRTARSAREFAELLRDLVARGRAAGVIVCAATQKPASDVVPVGVAGPVRVSAGAALQHAAGLGHDPRPGLGHARPQRRHDRARATRRRVAARRRRPARPMRAFTSTTPASTRSPRRASGAARGRG